MNRARPTWTRRDLALLSAASGALASLQACRLVERRRPEPLDLLVLGGTNFVGPAVVERAVARGHRVTLFKRGITRPELFPGLEKLRGERAADGGDLRALEGERRWDAVVDVWPAESALVDHTARLLAQRVDYAFFVSSIAVYADFSRAGLDEASPVHEDDPGWYGGEKVLAERALERAFGERCGIARCHAILGPRDDGHALHYWLRRLAEQDEVLAPGAGDDPVQLVDVRDVAGWIVDCVEARRPGIHNLTGPSEPRSFRELLETCRSAIGSAARLTWVDADVLRGEHGVRSFSDLPLWAPLDEDPGFQQIRGDAALAAGLRLRPLRDTARDAWAWWSGAAFDGTRFPLDGLGLARERERAILDAVAARG